MMHVNTQFRRVPSNSCQHTSSKREFYTSIKCPVVAAWCPLLLQLRADVQRPARSAVFLQNCEKSSHRRKEKLFHICQLSDGRLLDFSMACSPGYQMFKNPRQKTMVSTKKSSPAHQGQSCAALHSPDLSAIQEACHVRADLLSVQDMSKNETHKSYRLWTCQFWQLWVWKLHTEWKAPLCL